MRSVYDLPDSEIVPAGERVARGIELSDPMQLLDLKAIFGNKNPLELEIGYGKGLFLMQSGYRFPDVNFLGIEYALKYYGKACERIEKRPIKNVRLAHGEAFEFMKECLPDASLQKIHLYFPDPWPKKRHFKRRLFQMPFLELAHQKLTKDGYLYLATDHKGYWEWMLDILGNQTLFKKTELLPLPPIPETNALTNYEIKYQKEGREINRGVYQKT